MSDPIRAARAGSAGAEAAAAKRAGGGRIRLARWSCTTGSNVQSRAVVVVESGERQWRATAEGNGAVDALYHAVDRALADVLAGHPRLLAYDVHALAEGPSAEGRVSVEVAPPAEAPGQRGAGTYRGDAQSTNIIAASVEAYIDAIDAMLAEEHWAGATESARSHRRARGTAAAAKVEIDRSEDLDTSGWFER